MQTDGAIDASAIAAIGAESLIASRLARLTAERDAAAEEAKRLRSLVNALAERVAVQAEILAKRAEGCGNSLDETSSMA